MFSSKLDFHSLVQMLIDLVLVKIYNNFSTLISTYSTMVVYVIHQFCRLRHPSFFMFYYHIIEIFGWYSACVVLYYCDLSKTVQRSSWVYSIRHIDFAINFPLPLSCTDSVHCSMILIVC